MSTKGQIVIPNDLRTEFQVGEKLVVIKNKGQLIIKKASKLEENLMEDIKFAKRTEAALKRVERGRYTSLPAKEFIKEMKKW